MGQLCLSSKLTACGGCGGQHIATVDTVQRKKGQMCNSDNYFITLKCAETLGIV